jgi:acyl carrier protein
VQPATDFVTGDLPGKLFRQRVPLLDLHLHKKASVLVLNYTNFMKDVTPSGIRQFLLDKYRGPIEAIGFIPEDLADDFDFLLTGVIDSFGILEMISAIETEFEIELDLEALDAEQITILGPLSRFIAGQDCFRNVPNPDATSS